MVDFVNFVNNRKSFMPHQDGENSQAPIVPQIDGSNVAGSLMGMLGPSPQEKAAEEAQLQKHRRKMHAWTSVFNGLRHLGNLYYTAKGAQPQKYGEPHAAIEKQYQDERKRLDDIQASSQKYYANLWNLYRQGMDERRRTILADAQAKYYGTRDEAAQQKAELDRLKAVRVIKQTDGSLVKYDPVSGETEKLTESDPLYIEWMRSRINKNDRPGGSSGRSNGTYGDKKKRWMDEQGVWHEERVPTTGGEESKGSGYDNANSNKGLGRGY